jgi:hypothetical protein
VSPSEKLKALDALGREPSYVGTEYSTKCARLVSALPQIVAVTSAAEKLYAEAATAAPLWDEINDALIALEEALT